MNNKERSGIATTLAVVTALSTATTVAAASENDFSTTPKISSTEKLVGDMPSAIGLEKLADANNLSLDGNEVEYTVQMDVPAQIVNNRTMVPIRFIAENLDCKVDWIDDGQKHIVTIVKDGVTISFTKDRDATVFSNNINVGGVNKTVDVPAQIIGTRTMVPLRFLSETLGFGVDWYQSSPKNVSILAPGSDGKVLAVTIGGNEVEVMQNTYEAGIRRAVFFANETERQKLVASLETGTGPIEPPTFILDKNTGAQINYLNTASGKFETETAMQTDFTSKFGGVELTKDNTVYVFPDKLAIYTGFDKKNIEVYTASNDSLQEINSTSDIIVSYDTKLSVKNTEGATYNLDTRQWEIDVTKTPEYVAAQKVVVANLETALNYFGLNKNEINTYKQTGKDEGLNSFQILNYIDANGKELPGIVLVTNGEYGMSRYINEMKQSIDWLNTVDPTLVRSLLSAKYISSDASFTGGIWNIYPKYTATYHTEKSMIFVNESSGILIDAPAYIRLGFIFMTESKAIELTKQNPNIKPLDVGVTKGQFALDWTNNMNNQGKLTGKEFRLMTNFATSTISYYQQNFS